MESREQVHLENDCYFATNLTIQNFQVGQINISGCVSFINNSEISMYLFIPMHTAQ